MPEKIYIILACWYCSGLWPGWAIRVSQRWMNLLSSLFSI